MPRVLSSVAGVPGRLALAPEINISPIRRTGSHHGVAARRSTASIPRLAGRMCFSAAAREKVPKTPLVTFLTWARPPQSYQPTTQLLSDELIDGSDKRTLARTTPSLNNKCWYWGSFLIGYCHLFLIIPSSLSTDTSHQDKAAFLLATVRRHATHESHAAFGSWWCYLAAQLPASFAVPSSTRSQNNLHPAPVRRHFE